MINFISRHWLTSIGVIHPNFIKILYGLGISRLSINEVQEYSRDYNKLHRRLEEMELVRPSLSVDEIVLFLDSQKIGIDFLTNQPKYRLEPNDERMLAYFSNERPSIN